MKVSTRTAHHARQIEGGLIDAVIGHARLRVTVGADFLAVFACVWERRVASCSDWRWYSISQTRLQHAHAQGTLVLTATTIPSGAGVMRTAVMFFERFARQRRQNGTHPPEYPIWDINLPSSTSVGRPRQPDVWMRSWDWSGTLDAVHAD